MAGETTDRTLQSFALDARLTRMAEYVIGLASILVDGRPSRRACARAGHAVATRISTRCRVDGGDGVTFVHVPIHDFAEELKR